MNHKIGDERYLLEHISMGAWRAAAKAAGWDGQEESFDAMRPFCAPEHAATRIEHKDLKSATQRARLIFKEKPNDSVFGAIMIEHQILGPARDDSGDIIDGVPPEWETQQTWEVTADGAISNCGWQV